MKCSKGATSLAFSAGTCRFSSYTMDDSSGTFEGR
jgi:hypothetical protein